MALPLLNQFQNLIGHRGDIIPHKGFTEVCVVQQ